MQQNPNKTQNIIISRSRTLFPTNLDLLVSNVISNTGCFKSLVNITIFNNSKTIRSWKIKLVPLERSKFHVLWGIFKVAQYEHHSSHGRHLVDSPFPAKRVPASRRQWFPQLPLLEPLVFNISWKGRHIDLLLDKAPKKKVTRGKIWRPRRPGHENVITSPRSPNPSTRQPCVKKLPYSKTPVWWCTILLKNEVIRFCFFQMSH